MEIKIKIKIKDVEIEVDQKDLKELYEFLDSMFGRKETVIIDRHPWYKPYREYWWYTPQWIRYDDNIGGTGDRTNVIDPILTTGDWSNTDGSISMNCSIGK